MKTKFTIVGLREVEKNMRNLRKATAKAALKRAATKGLEPFARAARRLAPKDEDYLSENIEVSEKTRGRPPRIGAVQVYAGPTNPRAAMFQEFGTEDHAPQAYMRPAWDNEREKIVDETGFSIFEEIQGALDRVAKRSA